MRPEHCATFLPPLEGPSDAEVLAAKAVIEARQKALTAQAKGTLIQCSNFVATGKGCGQLTPIGDLEAIQTQRYEGPHGCTGGDYWYHAEVQWACPKCGHRNRLYNMPNEGRDLKTSFKSVRVENDQ